MNGGRTLGALSSHGLIEVHCHSGIEKLPRSHKALEMVPLEQSKGIPKLWMMLHCLNIEIKLEMKWSGSTIWIALNGRQDNHRPLDDNFRVMPKGRWDLAGGWESGCACVDVSTGPKALALLGGMRCTNGLGGWEVGGLRVAYQPWGGLDGTPPLEDWTGWTGSQPV